MKHHVIFQSHKNLSQYKDSFGESGTPEQLIEKYKLNNQAIVEAVERVMKRK